MLKLFTSSLPTQDFHKPSKLCGNLFLMLHISQMRFKGDWKRDSMPKEARS